MNDRLISVAAMLDASPGERDNASSVLQRMLASRDRTLTEFIAHGLEQCGIPDEGKNEVLAEAVFPFDTARITRLTELLAKVGLTWRALALGTPVGAEGESELDSLTRDPHDTIFANGTRRRVSIERSKKKLVEYTRDQLPAYIIAMFGIRETGQSHVIVAAYTQDAETVHAFGDFIITDGQQMNAINDSIQNDRALMVKVVKPRKADKPLTLEIM